MATTGPGAPIVDATSYSLSGVAFVDANDNGVLDAGEPVLPNVTVTLSDGQSTRTSLNGTYLFEGLLSGGYEVEIPAATAEVTDDFNELLAEFFAPTTAPVVSVVIGPDLSGQNFGFGVNTLALMDDFDTADPDGDDDAGPEIAGVGAYGVG